MASHPPAPPLPAQSGPVTHLLYLHGFRSSPQSAKARQVAARVAALNVAQPGSITWCCPQLPPSPAEAARLIESSIAGWVEPPRSAAPERGPDRLGATQRRSEANMAVIGSSLGGFYATWVAERQGCRAVLLNPAIDPARDLRRYIGEHTSWHNPDERFYFQEAYIDELRALQCGPVAQPEQYFSVMAKGDEVLDWREMTARYAGTRIKLLPTGDHALSDFDDHIDEVFAFLGLG